jgi:adenosylmethionine-8-amino-7-oxononanoate aminotransferase
MTIAGDAVTTMTASTDPATSEGIAEADRRHMVHGFERASSDAAPGPIFRSGTGSYLVDTNGDDWLDACAGQANVSLGYGRDDLADVAAEAIRELSFGTHFYSRRSHVPAALLAEKLASITPGNLNRFFFALGGSDAVDTAIKIARFVNVANGRLEKVHIIGRWNSYHGMTHAAASLTGDPGTWKNMGPLVPGFSHIAQPVTDSTGAAQLLEDEILRIGADKVAAFMAEPISTPNGIVVPPEDYWPSIREICSRHGVLFIADEVLTGFGRTGKMFGMDHWGVVPDMMTMSKAITAGVFPLAAVAVSDEVHDALEQTGEPFIHGFTAGGHPAACAVALATIDVMEREDVIERSLPVSRYLRDQLRDLADQYPQLDRSSVRGLGMMVAVDITDEVSDQDAVRLFEAFFARRLLVRTYRGNRTIGFLPPLTLSQSDVDDVIARMTSAASEVFPSR